MNLMKFTSNSKGCINFGLGYGNKTTGEVVMGEFLGL
jgi:hypothetical protein